MIVPPGDVLNPLGNGQQSTTFIIASPFPAKGKQVAATENKVFPRESDSTISSAENMLYSFASRGLLLECGMRRLTAAFRCERLGAQMRSRRLRPRPGPAWQSLLAKGQPDITGVGWAIAFPAITPAPEVPALLGVLRRRRWRRQTAGRGPGLPRPPRGCIRLERRRPAWLEWHAGRAVNLLSWRGADRQVCASCSRPPRGGCTSVWTPLRFTGCGRFM